MTQKRKVTSKKIIQCFLFGNLLNARLGENTFNSYQTAAWYADAG